MPLGVGSETRSGVAVSPSWDDEKKRLASAMRSNPTAAEAALWDVLRRRPQGLTFWSQHVIRGWIADFYCPAARLVIEVDGSAHKGREAHDQLRDEVMRAYRFGVLRFTNQQVHADTGAVAAKIVEEALRRGGRQREDEMAARRSRQRALAQERAQRAAEEPRTVSPSKPATPRVRAKVERIPAKPAKARFRCTWCLHEWVANIKDIQECRRCPGADVDRLCKNCNFRVAHPRLVVCVPCGEASHIARGAVGAGGDEFGVGKHRARKVL